VTVLADTSIWVRHIREGTQGPAAGLDDLLARGLVVICGPVAAELIAGTAERDREELWAALGALPWAGLDRSGWRTAGECAGTLRRGGSPLPMTDIVIAATALAAGASVWSLDQDFVRIADALPGLELYSPQPGSSR